MYTQGQTTRKNIQRLVLIVLACCVAAYGAYEARFLVAGPSVVIDTPTTGSATSSARVMISGSASHIAFLSINDVQAFTDTSGHFSKEVSLPPGHAVITVAAKDRFGRSVSRITRVTVLDYCPA